MKFLEVQAAMFLEGLSSINIRYLGNNLVLLSYNEGQKLISIVEKNQEWLSNIFIDIKPWNTSVAPGAMLVWACISGLPLHLWSEECSRKALACVGLVVGVAEETKMLECDEFVRVLVWMLASVIDSVKKFKINGDIWEVREKEESEYNEARRITKTN